MSKQKEQFESSVFIETQWGQAQMSFTDQGISRFRLPKEYQDMLPLALMPPQWVLDAKTWVKAYFKGDSVDLSVLPLDIKAAPFFTKVYDTVHRIPYGETLTYADVARLSGSPKAARAVGQAMARNPVALIIPCHRVLAAHAIGGFSSAGGADTKNRMLALEGVFL